MKKITFGSIVFNILDTLPENMFEYCIQNIYDIAHEIIIVEGATRVISGYYDGNAFKFTDDGRSTDGTIEYLYYLQKKYPKIKIIIGEGFWNGKTAMCNEYAKIAQGDYIWQLDSDEFYHEKELPIILDILEKQSPDAIHFYANHFFGDFNHCIDERSKKWANVIPWMRIFKNVPDKSYWLSHEPPQYVCDGLICNNGKVITRDMTLSMGIKMYHYSFVQHSQILFKKKFYGDPVNGAAEYETYWDEYKTKGTTNPFGDNIFAFSGEHPQIIINNYIDRK